MDVTNPRTDPGGWDCTLGVMGVRNRNKTSCLCETNALQVHCSTEHLTPSFPTILDWPLKHEASLNR